MIASAAAPWWWTTLRSRAAEFFWGLALFLLLAALPARAAVWRFSGGGLSGSAEVQTVGKTTMAAMDQIAPSLDFQISPEKKDELLISGSRTGLRLVRGAAVVWLGYNVIALPARTRMEKGHWWVEADAALRVMSQFLRRNGKNVTLKWAGAVQEAPPPVEKKPSPPEKKQPSLPRLKALRWGGGGDSVRIVADLEGEREPLCSAEADSITLRVAPMDRALAQSLRSRNDQVTLEVQNRSEGVLTFRFPGWKGNCFFLRDPFRCVIDLTRLAEAPKTPPPAPEKTLERASGKKKDRQENPPKVQPRPPERKKTPLVVIDAGHGGKDPGAIYRQYREKTIALQIASKVAEELRRRGVNVRMTRTGDTYPTLKQRTAMANEWKADVFLSIHLNALPRGRHASGMEIYIMALPSDRDAMELAKIENAEIAEEGTAADGSTDQRTEMLLSILGNMQQNVKISESTLLAEALFSAGVKSGINMRRVGQAPFWVLRGAAMPAVLIETGFITELSEARQLSRPTYQTKMAKSIADGVVQFLKH